MIYPSERLKGKGVLYEREAPPASPGRAYLRVLSQDANGYRLSPTKELPPDYLSASEAEEKGLLFLSLEEIARVFGKYPELTIELLGVPPEPDVIFDSGSFKLRLGRRMLRASPEDGAAFIPFTMPKDMPPVSVELLERHGDWLLLRVEFRFIYNAAEPPACARSLFHRTIEGWWKIPYDENGYPYLLPEALKPGVNWNEVKRLGQE